MFKNTNLDIKASIGYKLYLLETIFNPTIPTLSKGTTPPILPLVRGGERRGYNSWFISSCINNTEETKGFMEGITQLMRCIRSNVQSVEEI